MYDDTSGFERAESAGMITGQPCHAGRGYLGLERRTPSSAYGRASARLGTAQNQRGGAAPPGRTRASAAPDRGSVRGRATS